MELFCYRYINLGVAPPLPRFNKYCTFRSVSLGSFSIHRAFEMTIISSAIDLAVEFRWYLIAALAAAYIAKSYSEYRRLRAFRGPILAQWTDLWLAKHAFGTDQCRALAEVCEDYGMH